MSGAESLRWRPLPVPLPGDGELRAFELEGEALLVCRVGEEAFVLRNACSHVATPLAGGVLHGHLLECPLHGGRIDVRDGSPAAPPIRRPVRVYPVRRRGEEIEVGLAAGPA